MIEVELTDGTIVEFPDGTSQDVMRTALQKRFGKPQPAEQSPAVPDDVRARWEAARNGTLEASPESISRHEAANAVDGQGFGNNVAQKAGDGLFFGFGDEISARLNAMTGYDANTGTYGNSTTYDDQLAAVRGQEQQFRQDHPVVSTVSEIGGAMIPAALGVSAVARGGGLASKIGRGALSGAAMGGAYGFGEGEGGVKNRTEGAKWNALLGGFVGGAIPAIGAGIGALSRNRSINRAVNEAAGGAQTSSQLKAAGRAAYDAVDNAGVEITPTAFDRFRAEALDNLRNNTGYDELPGVGVTPKTARVMQTLDEASGQMAGDPTAALPFRSIDLARRRAGAAAQDFTNKADQQAGTTLIKQIDDFVQGLGPEDVSGGDVETLKSAITKARETWAQARRSELIDDAIAQSDNYVSGGASGVRNQLARILRNKKLSSGFSDTERKVLQRVINGGFWEQLVHASGSRAGQGLTTAIAAGAGSFGGPVGSAAGAGLGMGVAGGARMGSNALAMRGIERARSAIASGMLRDPQVMNALAVAGQGTERLVNRSLFSALPVTTNALSGR